MPGKAARPGADPLVGYLVDNRGECEAIAVGKRGRGAPMMLASGEAVIIAGAGMAAIAI